MRSHLVNRLLVTAVVVLAVGGCSRLQAGAIQSTPPSATPSAPTPSSTPTPSVAPTPSPTDSASTARSLLATLLSAQPHGTASAAAYVVTTYGALEASLAPESRLPLSADAATHAVIVLKVFGSFPDAHRGAPGANTDATTIVASYDTTTDAVVSTTYYRGPEPADLPGAPASTRTEYADLRTLGTPVALAP